MKLKTRVFGEIDIDDEKIITFEWDHRFPGLKEIYINI